MNDDLRYMPHGANTIKGRAQRVFRSFAYHLWQRKLTEFRGRSKPGSNLRIADLGCGPGFLLENFAKWFPEAELIGIDTSDRLLEVARERCPTGHFIKGDVSSLPIQFASVDVLFALHVVEHLTVPADFFGEARRVLRPGGMLIIATPNADGVGARLMKEKWVGHSDPTHICLNGPAFWRQALANAGFSIQRDGTTGLSGLPVLNKFPVSLIHWIPTFIFGYYPWELGEAYICEAIRADC